MGLDFPAFWLTDLALLFFNLYTIQQFSTYVHYVHCSGFTALQSVSVCNIIYNICLA